MEGNAQQPFPKRPRGLGVNVRAVFFSSLSRRPPRRPPTAVVFRERDLLAHPCIRICWKSASRQALFYINTCPRTSATMNDVPWVSDVDWPWCDGGNESCSFALAPSRPACSIPSQASSAVIVARIPPHNDLNRHLQDHKVLCLYLWVHSYFSCALYFVL